MKKETINYSTLFEYMKYINVPSLEVETQAVQSILAHINVFFSTFNVSARFAFSVQC